MKRAKPYLIKGNQYWFDAEEKICTYVTDGCGGVYAGCAYEDGYTFTVLKSSLLSIEDAQRHLVTELFFFSELFDAYEYWDIVYDKIEREKQKQQTLEEIRRGNLAYILFYLDSLNLDEEGEHWKEDIKNKLNKLGGKQ